MDQLLEKLMKSKAIMQASDNIKRGDLKQTSFPEVQTNFDIPQAKYNIPSDFLSESESNVFKNQTARENTKPVGSPTIDSIKKSKLPDEIKKLMIEHPISQPQQPQATISNELIEKASKLMRQGDKNYIPESEKIKQSVSQNSVVDYELIQKMINETIETAFQNSGLLVESTEKANDTFTFRVGKHIFEGKISKVKKMS